MSKSKPVETDPSYVDPNHVDRFIDDFMNREYYARWFFALHRFPAHLSAAFVKWIRQYELYCTHEGMIWRVVGCSRMGDVWLKVRFDAPPGTNEGDERWVGAFYDKRVDIHTCSNWSEKP